MTGIDLEMEVTTGMPAIDTVVVGGTTVAEVEDTEEVPAAAGTAAEGVM
jgi:hypothetical protein